MQSHPVNRTPFVDERLHASLGLEVPQLQTVIPTAGQDLRAAVQLSQAGYPALQNMNGERFIPM